jgi:hypothetical protein
VIAFVGCTPGERMHVAKGTVVARPAASADDYDASIANWHGGASDDRLILCVKAPMVRRLSVPNDERTTKIDN